MLLMLLATRDLASLDVSMQSAESYLISPCNCSVYALVIERKNGKQTQKQGGVQVMEVQAADTDQCQSHAYENV